MTAVLAVDGGNSKTDAAIVGDDGSLLGYVRGPQASPDHLGLDGSLDVVEGLASTLGGSPELAMLLLAGLDFPDEEDAYRVRAERRLALRVVAGNDTFAVLRAGSESGVGAAVTCGAGINCVGVAADGRRVRFASLGAWSGDWGGGLDLGGAAVWAAARSEDGRGPHTILERLVPAHFGLETPTELARALLRAQVNERELAELAPLVLASARSDAVAGEIVDRLAAEVVTMARTALTRLGLTEEPVDVVLGGGVLQAGDERLLGGIERGLRDVAPAALLRLSPSPPIVGSALLGLDELGAGPEAHDRVRAELGAAAQAEAANRLNC
jgi:N-acetylglucosamine kinase-like BadF-type ATPase